MVHFGCAYSGLSNKVDGELRHASLPRTKQTVVVRLWRCARPLFSSIARPFAYCLRWLFREGLGVRSTLLGLSSQLSDLPLALCLLRGNVLGRGR